MSKVDDDLQIEKKQDIVKILNNGLLNLGLVTTGRNDCVNCIYSSIYNDASIEIRNPLSIYEEVSVCGTGSGMSHLLEIGTIQKAYDYITILKKHLTEQPVKSFIKELKELKGLR